MENIMDFENVKRKIGRPRKADVPREVKVSVRVTDFEKEAIKQYFGSFDKMRDFVLGEALGKQYAKMLEKAGIEAVNGLLKKGNNGNVSPK